MNSKVPGYNFFLPVKAGRAVEEVILQLEAAIIENKIAPGEKLPSEREMQVQFKTGRGVIREALQVLKQKDLVEIKKGARGGAFVKNVEVVKISESLSLFLKQNNIPPQSIVEFRQTIDNTISTLAIARGEKSEKEKLVSTATRLKELVLRNEPDMEPIIELDRELNTIFVKMTKNPVFEWVMRALQSGFSSYDYALYQDAEFRKKAADNWISTAKEIEAGEPLKASSYVNNHYLLLKECINSGSLKAGALE